MKDIEKHNLITHLNNHFDFLLETVLEDDSNISPKIDILLYSPTRLYPFWKLITAGASDYSIPKVKAPLKGRNEYIMFVDPKVHFFVNNDESKWYINFIRNLAKKIKKDKLSIKPYCVIGIPNDNEIMTAATFMPPLAIDSEGIDSCKLARFKECDILQVMPLDEESANLAAQKGEKWIINEFYEKEYDDDLGFIARKNKYTPLY